jgi:glutathione S-transferase
MITVYAFPKSRSTRITWMLEELKVEYTCHIVNFMKGEHRSNEYLAVNPGGKVPALKDGELVLVESGAIVTYLGDKFPESGLVPPTSQLTNRGQYEQWCYFALTELEQPLWTMGKHKFALPEEKRVPEIMETAAWEFQVALGLLSQGLAEKPYILGKEFSAADILLGHTLLWGLSFKQSIQQPNLQAYIDRLKARPALIQAWAKETGGA